MDYKDDLLNGITKIYFEGCQLLKEGHYKDAELISLRQFDEEGNLVSEQ